MALNDIPAEFLWGTATASFQIEGATMEDGRGESIWDRFCATPGKIKNGDGGEPACDHYHRYREDVAVMKQLGLGGYRFSIAWPRILPEGTGTINDKGLDFYDRLVDELLGAGIRPFVTLYHWDLPQALQERWGGWAGRDTAQAFAEYADVVSRRLGDRVKDWITLNEPWVVAWLGHAMGMHAPGLHDPALAVQVAHHLLLGHGLAVPVLRRNSSGARVGITLNLAPIHALTDSEADRAAAHGADAGVNRLFLDPLFRGTYPPEILGQYPGWPAIRPGDFDVITAPLDFLGVNYYTRWIMQADDGGRGPLGQMARLDGVERTAMDWEVYPEGLHELLLRVHNDYAPPALYVTENGAAFEDAVTPDGAVHDPARQRYLEAHFAQAGRAIVDGVPLKGYFVWSLLDNFEWAEGYGMRFGLIYVDYATQQRIIKDSGHWYAGLLRGAPVG